MTIKVEYVKVTFDDGEFAEKFPDPAARTDLNSCDKIRVALGLQPRKAKAGASKKNAVGNKGAVEIKKTLESREYFED